MRETTIRLDEELIEDLDDEADEKGMTRSAYIRQILTQRPEVSPTTAESLKERLDEVEERIGELEDG
ncbi:ribbon-helix-helix domain-containing protein [Halococcus saccharolyticus]|uniref:Ribbon-helix-helix protein CopG domain-containing protein n=1 Tax=Halococcus saccharolyticus DSM 5350 TaxID=1227455 RepID=M0MQG3_9EURY|nr:CopG family transcriptional regulator [Halococcus saccharolyticus]EMA47962.1 hypothetical protein C449_00780 [Halococcus saccharolyticus DSM 5350]